MKLHLPFCLFFVVAGCHAGEHSHSHGAHGHGHGDHHGHGHQTDSGRPSQVITRWGKQTQLFVEFPALVKGEKSPLAAHLTLLAGHQAVRKGILKVELSGGGKPKETFSSKAPSQHGIYRPIVKPQYAGKRTISFRFSDKTTKEEHRFSVEVYSEVQKAQEALASEEEDGAQIVYLLEQQWKVPFAIEPVTSHSLRPTVPALAKLKLPSDAETIITAPRSGRISKSNYPRLGSTVQLGQTLFTLGAALGEAADAASLDLAVERSEIAVTKHLREFKRLEPLAQQGIIPSRRLETVEAQLSQARAELRSAQRRRANLGSRQRIKGQGEGLSVPSPISGQISEVLVAPGSWVTQGAALAKISHREALWLEAGVPEQYLHRLKDISGLWFTLEGSNRVFEVSKDSLSSIGHRLDARSRTLAVRFRLEKPSPKLYAGTTFWAHLQVDKTRQAIAIPRSAVVDVSGVETVYVQTEGEAFEARPVRLGLQDGNYIEVISGLEKEEWVVSQGAYQLKLAAASPEAMGHGHAH